MSIQIPITPKELRTIGRMLAKPQDIICLDNAVFVKITLVAMDRLNRGQVVNAKVVAPSAVSRG